MSVFRASGLKTLFAAPGKPLLFGPLRQSGAVVTGSFAGPFPSAITGLSGWWDAGNPTNLIGAGGLALSDFGPGVTAAADLSGGGNPLSVFHYATTGTLNAPTATPRCAALLGGLGYSTITPPAVPTAGVDLPCMDPDNGLRLASSQMGSGSAWTRYLVWTRPTYRQGYGLTGAISLLTAGTTTVLAADSTSSPTRLILFPGSSQTVLTTALEHRHTHSVIIRNTPGTGVDVWLDGTQVATAAPNVMPASATAQLLFLHSGSSSGGAQCWFHEAATWERALSSGDIATLLSCATRWPRGARKGIAIVPIGQSNCGNALGDGAWNVMVQGIAWHLGAVSWNVVGKYGSDGSSTCTAGRGLYGGSEATYNGTYLTYVSGADPSTWALGADGTGVGVWINQSVLAADKADIAAILLPWSETDSIRPYSEMSLYMGAMKQFISLMRASLGKTAAQFPIFWWNAIPYSGGSTGGMQMVRETAAALAADPTQNVVITMPQTSDSNSRGATWNATTGAQSGGDSEHRDAPDNITFGRRAAVVAARALITAGVYDTLSSIPTGLPVVGGPSIVSAHLATSTTVVVTIVHDAGTDLIVPLMAAQGDGWALMENGSVATPGTMIAATACVRSSPTTLTLTLASAVTAPGANCLLFYPYGTPTMSRGNAVTDNYASLTRPAGWDIGHDLGSAWTFNWPLAATFTPIAMT